ncbi:MAG: M15 family metallopeptidase [Thiobacillus sp.]|nr:M15 family metallopeptidase [Thiobacillus sp.]
MNLSARLLPILFLAFLFSGHALALPEGFVYLSEAVPLAREEVRYATADNFVGRPVDGYRTARVVLSRPAAEALDKVARDLAPFGLGIKVFDGYRPQMAVDHFVRWAADLANQATKHLYYPGVAKEHLFRDGYIAEKSGHSRGSTVDLTLVNLADGGELPMGTPFDFFGPESWPDHPGIPAAERAHRLLLRQVMERHGFRPLKEEWWHFTLESEPWPGRYYNFPVE